MTAAVPATPAPDTKLDSVSGAAAAATSEIDPGPTVELPPNVESVSAGAPAPPGPSTPIHEASASAAERAELLDYGLKPTRQRANDTSIGGYAELHYSLEHVAGAGSTQAQLDLHRMVLFLAHRFNDKLRFYSEVEVEHAVASPDRGGEVEIEQAYLDYLLLGQGLGVRAGVILVPMGIINSWHEPPIFHGVERPAVDTVIIPSTWREGGIGIFGEPVEGLRYQLYVMGGLNPAGFSTAQGIREGRQEVSEGRANGLAAAGRVEVEPVLGVVAGVSGYVGLAGPNADLYDSAGAKLQLDVPVWGASADVRARRAGLEARAVVVVFGIGDTAMLRQAFDAGGQSLGIDVGAQLWGAYGELAYDVLRPFVDSEQQLLPFVRLERYDTLASIRGRRAAAADKAFAVSDLVTGVTYRPIPQVAFKSDFLFRNPDGANGSSIQFDLGVGVMF